MKKLKLLPLILIPLALVAGLYLVKQEQETRKSAAGVAVDAYLAGAITSNNFPVKFGMNMGAEHLVGFTAKFKYTSETLSVDSVVVNDLFSGNDPELNVDRKLVFDTETPGEIILSCISYQGASGRLGLENPLISFDFNVIGEGEAKVWLDETYQRNQFVRQAGDHLVTLNGKLDVAGYVSEDVSPTLTPVPGDCHRCDTHSQGDADCDNDIDLMDLRYWIRGRYETDDMKADFNCDNEITTSDLSIWIQNRY